MKKFTLAFSIIVCLFFSFFEGYSQSQDINVRGGSPYTNISFGDTSPTTAKGTQFGSTQIGTPVVRTFEIQNTHSGGNPSNNVLTISSITKSGTNAADFTITSSITNITRNNSATFTISFNPTAAGLRTATITINSNDTDENPWTFRIEGTGTIPPPEIDIRGLGTSIPSGDVTPITIDNTSWGSVLTSSSSAHTFSIHNTANAASTLIISQGVDITFTSNTSGYFSITSQPVQNTNISGGSNTTFEITYNPLTDGTHTAVVSINNNDSNENPYTFTLTGTSYTPAPEIKVMGGSVLTEIVDGDTTPQPADGTAFGNVNVGNSLQKIYTIDNTAGTAALTISSITLSNTTDFSITTAYNSPVAAGGTTTFGITYTGNTVGAQTCTITINNNDSNESVYDFVIEATTVQLFYDSDNDGVFDDQDIDDDNDGIIDSEEENNCSSSPISYSVNYKFLEETFGTGTARTTINTSYAATTDYCWEDGTGDDCTNSATDDADLDDGEYTVYYTITNNDGVNQTPNDELASWADDLWAPIEDHTPGDTNGRMAVFNASFDPGVFYTAQITGALPNVPVTYSFYAVNLDKWDHPDIETRERPNIRVEFQDLNGNILDNLATPGTADAFFETGDIDPWNPANPDNGWFNYSEDLILSVNEFQVIFINNAPGGLGNDLAIDDIEIRQTLCDYDNDGIADIFDLDADNDGIPDIVEIGLGQLSNGTGKMDVAWVDANGDGLHDSAAGNIPLDSDGDGVPNYLDLDSDNDAIFDVDESGAGNAADSYFQNGDGDITGDGVGDGPESEAFREKDVYGTGVPEYFGDGILDIYDFHSSANNYTDAYGNDSQGVVTGTVYYVKDTDGDNIPDYIDTMSNGSTWDIAGTLYASLDDDNDGIIDDTNDTDGDGIVDLFDTDDTVFGSPRDLDRKLHLFFDGRNDYGEDTNVISSGEASIMVFIKSSGTNTLGEDRIIAGQDDFYLRINESDNTVSLIVEGTTITSSTAITDGIWTHIAATTESGNTKLYINGVEEVSDTSGGISDGSNFIIGRSSAEDQHFHGYMDELRVFSKALSADEIRKMIYQEIEDNSGNARGTIIPRDITDFVDESNIAPLNWSNLARYFRMDAYKDDIIDDLTTASIDTGTGAHIYNTKIIDYQTAPLPFITQQSGGLVAATTIASDGVNGNDVVNYDWSIVQISHDDVTYNANQKHIGLIVDALDGSSNPIEFSIQDDSELNVSWYLKLDGFIDLDGESQMVQGPDSELDVTSSGYIERDQQGTKDLFTYNYWSSPVGIQNNSSNNNNYTLPSILRDGSVASAPVNITFLGSGYNGNPGNPGSTPISVADYWIWKYNNKLSDTYSQWQHVRSTGTLLAGEGFTMKGVQNTGGNITLEQNYVFNGKPNNGDITLTISGGNDYLVGNPYPSALDADEFIKDNISVANGGRASSDIIDGTLYFWDHFASNTHILREYQGGYATYNLMSSAEAVSTDSRINATGDSGTKIPERYIPVSQGFFVVADAGGTVTFKNSQRIFKTEASDPSLFIKNGNTKSKTAASKDTDVDERQKFKLKFDSPKGYHRQIAVGVDENASSGYDLGYDAKLIETNKEDMFWINNDQNYVIQGVDNFNSNQKLPLGIKIAKEGLSKIKIDKLENIRNDLDIFLYDKDLDVYHNLKESEYEVYLTPGEYLSRFEIAFSNGEAQSLSTEETTTNNKNIHVYFSNEKESIIVHNPTLKEISSFELFNVLGQSIFNSNKTNSLNYFEYKTKQIKTGTYIVKFQTKEGAISKKILIN
ncbi:choice-of-anchor D domain-containing protein [Flavobacteriaceae bacterium XHP0103]|uniref:choice-of-anchor D domain-containing protein n=1 Tax=Marixanthotalea marina TaxID=2844359 RepID=UPI002989DFC3|nr:choice-of-anchor D domain-containing protein [Marixanthotalea marina]MBU3822833.1 choice-of-anchor D domain-containing protein [Marixanthotalea marina]